MSLYAASIPTYISVKGIFNTFLDMPCLQIERRDYESGFSILRISTVDTVVLIFTDVGLQRVRLSTAKGSLYHDPM